MSTVAAQLPRDVGRQGQERTLALVARAAGSYEALRNALENDIVFDTPVMDAGKGALNVHPRHS